jgi:acyl dehydratase
MANPMKVGTEFPQFTFPGITRSQLSLFAGGSADHNPMHIDVDAARKAGFEDVFAPGMLVMALLGRAMTSWIPQSSLRSWNVRFVAITNVSDVLTCRGQVTSISAGIGQAEVTVVNAAGEAKLAGEAIFDVEGNQ